MKPICHVVGAGDFDAALLQTKKGDLIIAADGGYRYLEAANRKADLYIGDGDSLGFQPEGIETVVLPTVKDDTDMIAALRVGLDRGYRRFHLYGALGGKRFSHSLANLSALAFLSEKGACGTILDPCCTVTLLEEGEHPFPSATGFFSLFPLGEEAVVSIEGAKYPLKRTTLRCTHPLGVSNEAPDGCLIRVHSGRLLLVSDSLRPEGTNA